MIRAFIAVDVEDPLILGKISSIRDLITKKFRGIKPVETENIHITLKFLGNIHDAAVDEIYEAMKKVDFTPFKISIQGVGAFPSISRPRVIWVGVREGGDRLKEIFLKLEGELKKLGYKPEPKGFSPHITIARVKYLKKREALTRILLQLENIDVGEMVVDSIRLKQSILTPKGPIYRTLKEVRGVNL